MGISKVLREEIGIKMAKISGDFWAYDKRRDLVRRDLRTIGDIYSFWIENPDLRRSLLLSKRQEDSIKKEAKKGVRAIKDAWYFLLQQGEDFINVLSPKVLMQTNRLINRSRKRDEGFRRIDVTLHILGYTPPSWEKVPKKLDELLERIKDLYAEDSLQASIMAHLELAAIQPFIEGNKRTARLVQDRLLDCGGFPPAIIPSGEGKYYFRLLTKTLPAYREGNVEGQRGFYDYCASKVNCGLDHILGDLDNTKMPTGEKSSKPIALKRRKRTSRRLELDF